MIIRDEAVNAPGKSQYATTLLLLVYVGLLVGDQSIPLLSNESGFPEFRLLLLAASFVLLPGLLAERTYRAWSRADTYFMSLVGFFGYMSLTTLWSPPGAETYSFYIDAAFLLTHVLIGMMAAFRMEASAWRLFWLAVVGISLLFAAAGFASGSVGAGRMSAFGGGPNVFVRIVGVGAIVSAYIAFNGGRVRWLVPAGILTAAAIFTGSRGGMIALALSLVLATAIGHKWIRRQRRVFLFAVASVIGALGAFAIFGELISEVLFTRFGEQLLAEGQTAGRDKLYIAGLDLWSDSYVFGSGIGSFSVEYGRGFTYTHNIVLDILVDGGLIGLLVFLIAIGVAVWPSSSLRTQFDAVLPATISVFYLVASQFSGTYYDTRFAWLFAGLACVSSVRATKLRNPLRTGVADV